MARTATYKTAAQGQMIHVLPQSFVYRLTPRQCRDNDAPVDTAHMLGLFFFHFFSGL